jgi:hypothetical protein
MFVPVPTWTITALIRELRVGTIIRPNSLEPDFLMSPQTRRLVFWAGFLMYAWSFFLSFVGGPGVYTPKLPSGAHCAFDWFFFPMVYVHLHSVSDFFTDAPIENVSVAASGWINPVFLLAVLFLVIGRTPKLAKTLRYAILLMLPFPWAVFRHQHMWPREGYILWTIGMVLVLFSGELEKKRSASGNQGSAA